MPRSRNYIIAAFLAGLLSLANAIIALALLPQGSDKLDASGNQPPYAVIITDDEGNRVCTSRVTCLIRTHVPRA